MLKITELNNAFEKRSFLVNAGTYNDLLGHSQGLARLVDSKDCMLRTWEEKASGLEAKTRKLETEIHDMKRKYLGALRRDPETGRYKKRKK